LFPSDYETFSIASAEALVSGIPLVGPHNPAIAEYAVSEDSIEVASRKAVGWHDAVLSFVDSWARSPCERSGISRRAREKFSETRLRALYRAAMHEIGVLDTHSNIQERKE
jgi:glycosyltransferase involved in cell wall biosynthesis